MCEVNGNMSTGCTEAAVPGANRVLRSRAAFEGCTPYTMARGPNCWSSLSARDAQRAADEQHYIHPPYCRSSCPSTRSEHASPHHVRDAVQRGLALAADTAGAATRWRARVSRAGRFSENKPEPLVIRSSTIQRGRGRSAASACARARGGPASRLTGRTDHEMRTVCLQSPARGT